LATKLSMPRRHPLTSTLSPVSGGEGASLDSLSRVRERAGVRVVADISLQ